MHEIVREFASCGVGSWRIFRICTRFIKFQSQYVFRSPICKTNGIFMHCRNRKIVNQKMVDTIRVIYLTISIDSDSTGFKVFTTIAWSPDHASFLDIIGGRFRSSGDVSQRFVFCWCSMHVKMVCLPFFCGFSFYMYSPLYFIIRQLQGLSQSYEFSPIIFVDEVSYWRRELIARVIIVSILFW